MEYVKEYQEKYDSYFSINKILESERFFKVSSPYFRNSKGKLLFPLLFLLLMQFTAQILMLRNEFLKFGRKLQAAKEKDMNNYYSILEELKESYRQCGTVRLLLLSDVFCVCDGRFATIY